MKYKLILTLGMLLILVTAGWTGFRWLFHQDMIPGRIHDIVLVPTAWPESGNEVRFAVIGDFGTGGRNQYRVAKELANTYRRQPFSLLLTTGDNVYSGHVTASAKEVIDKPYRPLFDADVEFRPSLGNHDLDSDDEDDLPRILGALRMPHRYYRFEQGPVDFFALDSNYLDSSQLAWLEQGLSCSNNHWQVVYFHHPPYSSGKHGSDLELRAEIESILVDGGADIAFSGHDHNYERIFPQQGVTYVVTGGGGANLRPVGTSEFTAVSESELHFVLVEVSAKTMRAVAIDDEGDVLDEFIVEPRKGNLPCDIGLSGVGNLVPD